MCGIAGYVGQGNEQVLSGMIKTIKYRGPDDSGLLIKDNVGLAHARLSIIDLSSAGHQPMSNAEKDVWVIFNGEIYNFQELRDILVKDKNYSFKSQTDTEVLIGMYEKYGEDFLARLNGMFSIALYDFKKSRLILARDKMGKKPLYWGVFNSTIIFASELKALLQHPLVKKEVNLSSLNKYLKYEYVPTPWSIFKNIYKLEPATYLVWQNSKIRKEKFWNLDFSGSGLSFSQALGQLGNKLDDAVSKRLVADVPLGIFLSGGIDSSTIAYYAQKNSLNKIKTFSIGFKEASFDESQYAYKVADFLNTDHYHQMLTAEKALATIPEITKLIDEPLADASIIPTFLLSRFTRQHVTVALGGDGGDELFAGYPTFHAEKFVRLYKKMPLLLRKSLLEKIIKLLPVRDTNFSLEFKFKKFISGVYAGDYYRHQQWLGSFNREERKQLLNSEVFYEAEKRDENEDIDRYIKEVKGVDFENQLLYLYLRTYLMDDVLVKVDRASMYNALEVRAPLLDYNLVEFASHLPYNYKYRRFQTKYILKKLMIKKLPKEIIFRQKKGFGLPISLWLKNELKEMCNEFLTKDKIKSEGLFNFEYIEKLKKDHFSCKKDNHKKIWSLMMWQMWQENWIN